MGNVTGGEARQLLSLVNAEMFSCQKVFTLSADVQKECTKSGCREMLYEELKKLRNKLTYIICQEGVKENG